MTTSLKQADNVLTYLKARVTTNQKHTIDSQKPKRIQASSENFLHLGKENRLSGPGGTEFQIKPTQRGPGQDIF